MLNAEFFTGYTAGQLPDPGDELCLSAPIIYWLGGQVMAGFNICFDPTTSELYAWCGELRSTINILLGSMEWVFSLPLPG